MLLEAPFRQLAEVARRSEAELPTTFSSKRLSLPAVGARAPAPPAGVSTLTTPAGAGPPFRARRFEGRFEGRLGAEWVAGDEPAVGASTLTPCSCRCLVAGLTCPAACALSAARAPGSRESEPKPHLRVLAEAAALPPEAAAPPVPACIDEDREASDEGSDEGVWATADRRDAPALLLAPSPVPDVFGESTEEGVGWCAAAPASACLLAASIKRPAAT